MRAYERFLKYIQYDTASDAMSETCPSTVKQLELAKALVDEMRDMGIADARVDADGYVYGSIPANAEDRPAIGLIAHMDVVDCVPCQPMRPRMIENYDGKAVTLDSGDVLDPAVFPEVADAARGCRFCDCTHTHEPGCRVRELLCEGLISQRRYDAYVALAAEMRESARTLDPDIVL